MTEVESARYAHAALHGGKNTQAWKQQKRLSSKNSKGNFIPRAADGPMSDFDFPGSPHEPDTFLFPGQSWLTPVSPPLHLIFTASSPHLHPIFTLHPPPINSTPCRLYPRPGGSWRTRGGPRAARRTSPAPRRRTWQLGVTGVVRG